MSARGAAVSRHAQTTTRYFDKAVSLTDGGYGFSGSANRIRA
jgi:hypothetical protein